MSVGLFDQDENLVKLTISIKKDDVQSLLSCIYDADIIYDRYNMKSDVLFLAYIGEAWKCVRYILTQVPKYKDRETRKQVLVTAINNAILGLVKIVLDIESFDQSDYQYFVGWHKCYKSDSWPILDLLCGCVYPLACPDFFESTGKVKYHVWEKRKTKCRSVIALVASCMDKTLIDRDVLPIICKFLMKSRLEEGWEI